MKNKRVFYQWCYYSRSQRIGFLLFVFSVIVIQAAIYFLYYHVPKSTYNWVEKSAKNNELFQQKVDSIRALSIVKKDTIYPFNPNFITDFKGQTLEMTTEEIDRLLAFRAANQYVNSAQEFQLVTKVSDQWIAKYSVYFKFPAWVVEKKNREQKYIQKTALNEKTLINEKIEIKDINKATAEDLQAIKGIGPAFSKRIIEERNKRGNFVHMDQLKFVYGLPDEVIVSLNKFYAVKQMPIITKVSINTAGINQLKEVPYLNYYIAREIVKYRSVHGDFSSKEDLTEIENFPLDKIHIISLYLDFTK